MARLTYIGRTAKGNHRLRAASKSAPGMTHDILVSKCGRYLRCDCQCAAYHPKANHATATLTVLRADVLAKRAGTICFHLKQAAKVAPLLLKGHVKVAAGAKGGS